MVDQKVKIKQNNGFGTWKTFHKDTDFKDFMDDLKEIERELDEHIKENNINLDDYKCKMVVLENEMMFSVGYKYIKDGDSE